MHSHLELVDRFLLLLLGRRAANVAEEKDDAVAGIVADAAAGGLLLHSIPNLSTKLFVNTDMTIFVQ